MLVPRSIAAFWLIEVSRRTMENGHALDACASSQLAGLTSRQVKASSR
jgi:hypothetical protein